jgi:phage terminase small subunit
MPAPKPTGLNRRHNTAAEQAERESADAALRPVGLTLAKDAPYQLRGHETASRVWRRVMKTYAALEAEIVTYLDLDLLLDYCLLVEQISEMDEMRCATLATWKDIGQRLQQARDHASAEELANMVDLQNDAFEQITKLDSRADRKRALLLQMRQSLYLTPRARAAASPKRKSEEKPDDFGDEFD